MPNFIDIKLTKRERALLELLIGEINGCKDMNEIKTAVDSWVIPNDLHPETVQALNKDDLTQFLKGA